MTKTKDEDRELQIELTELQIRHEEAHSYNTVLLSIVASTLLATASVFGTLLATTDDLSYGYLSLIFDVPLFLFTIVVVRRTRKAHEDLDHDIKKLKDLFLSKQTPTEVKENKTTENKTQGGNWKVWLRKAENVALILSLVFSIVALLFTGLSTYREWNPPVSRAKLTIFIDYPQFMRATDSTVTDVTVNINVVNDSPLTATIREWNLSLNYNTTYQTLNRVMKSGNLTLSPSTQTDFTITTTLEGQNHTVLPDTAIRNIVFTVLYQDEGGLQEATREYGFA